MSYLALYRKWRPGTFGEVVGQPHVVGTLHNALRAGKISHAYLFCGSRGTGKTSMAKILAKALNCTSLVEGEPCNRCDSCVKINEGRFMDILEIDAASNRGIDEMRELREKINMAPAEGLYKVYIIDEVHMLTPEAFNALLKTLEEPPAHVVFVLATTEPHKIPLTILSRCQRFEFHRIGIGDIVGRLREVVNEGAIDADEEALRLIAKLAQGGLRDALSLLDQCLTTEGIRLDVNTVAAVAGVANDEWMADWVDSLIAGDAAGVLRSLHQALRDGKQSGQLLSDLIGYLRNMLVLSLGAEARELVPVSSELAERLVLQGRRMGTKRLFGAVERLSGLAGEIKYGGSEQILLETGLIRLCRMLGDIPAELPESVAPKRQAQKAELQEGPMDVPVPADNRPQTSEPDAEPEQPVQTNVPENSPEKDEPTDTVFEAGPLWDEVKERLREEKKLTTLAFVVEGHPVLDGDTLRLCFSKKYEFHKNRSEKPEIRQEIEQCVEQVCGKRLSVACGFLEEDVVAEAGKPSGDELLDTIRKVFGPEKVEIVKEE